MACKAAGYAQTLLQLYVRGLRHTGFASLCLTSASDAKAILHSLTCRVADLGSRKDIAKLISLTAGANGSNVQPVSCLPEGLTRHSRGAGLHSIISGVDPAHVRFPWRAP